MDKKNKLQGLIAGIPGVLRPNLLALNNQKAPKTKGWDDPTKYNFETELEKDWVKAIGLRTGSIIGSDNLFILALDFDDVLDRSFDDEFIQKSLEIGSSIGGMVVKSPRDKSQKHIIVLENSTLIELAKSDNSKVYSIPWAGQIEVFKAHNKQVAIAGEYCNKDKGLQGEYRFEGNPREFDSGKLKECLEFLSSLKKSKKIKLYKDVSRKLELFKGEEYESWIKVGMALKHQASKDSMNEAYFRLFNSWSEKQGNSYKGEGDVRRHWTGIKDKHPNPITIASIIRKNKKGKRTANDKEEKVSFFDFLEEEFGSRIKYNQLKQEVELDGVALDLDLFYKRLERQYKMEGLGKDNVYDSVLVYAQDDYPYHPVRDYLNGVSGKSFNKDINVTRLAERYFGITENIDNILLYKHLLGSVARVYKPGVKKDECLVLVGKQGVGKTTFFQVLYKEDFFTSDVRSTSKDDLLKLHQHWCCELAELDHITSKKEAGELKGFLSNKIDCFRAPYARTTKSIPRSSVFVGTVNKDDFLRDETGNRRFWIIKLPESLKEIPNSQVAEERDLIWSKVVADYEAGVQFYLTKEESALIGERNENYQEEDPWAQALSVYISKLLEREQPDEDGYLYTSTTNILTSEEFNLFKSQIGTREARRIAALLRGMGWESCRLWDEKSKSRFRGWKKLFKE